MYILYLVQFSDDCMNMDDIYAWPPLKELKKGVLSKETASFRIFQHSPSMRLCETFPHSVLNID